MLCYRPWACLLRCAFVVVLPAVAALADGVRGAQRASVASVG